MESMLDFRLWRRGGLPLPRWLKGGRQEGVTFISHILVYVSGQHNTPHETPLMQESWLSI